MSTKLQLRPMTAEQFAAWHGERKRANLAALTAGGLSPQAAVARDDADFQKMLPQGLSTPGEHLGMFVQDQREVGFVWRRFRQRSAGIESFIHDFQFAPDLDPRAADAAMSLVEHADAQLGARWTRLNASAEGEASYRQRGYLPTRYRMSQSLVGASELTYPDAPPVRLEPMDEQQFEAYVERLRLEESTNRARAGITPPREAAEAATTQAEKMRKSRHEEGQHCLAAVSDSDEVVGRIWFALKAGPDGIHSIGRDFSVDEELRGKGYGRSILAETRRFNLANEVRSMSFFVYGYNSQALKLYEGIGYSVTQVQLRKDLVQPKEERSIAKT